MLIIFFAQFFLLPAARFGMSREASPVLLDIQQGYAVMSNGILKVNMTVPGGFVIGISYQALHNLLSTDNPHNNRGYWSVTWNHLTNKTQIMDKLEGTSFKVIAQSEDQVEVSFTRTWNGSATHPPLHVDRRLIMLRGLSGFYTYSIYERLEGWPGMHVGENRLAFKLRQDMFDYMAISNGRQRMMPTEEDRKTGQQLEYPEAVLLTNPIDPSIKGEVDDKYFYSKDSKDIKVHGWVSTKNDPPLGFWMICPSMEFRIGGPFKQDLTSHVGPTLLSKFSGRHYAGRGLDITFQNGEPWKKVFGPEFVYLNSDSSAENDPSLLWNDAWKRMNQEVENWPYDFPLSKDYMKSQQRGTVRGRLLVHDWFSDEQPVPASNAYVGLALPGEPGSWQKENKGYQFWTEADKDGNFIIKGVIVGTYALHATVPGRIGNYKYDSFDVNIKPGSDIELGDLVYKPPRNGATLWDIGVAERTAAEFYIPNPDPKYKVHKFKDQPKNKEYGLWKRYADLYPDRDLVFIVGKSDYSKDWFFAHVTRELENGTFGDTTRQIVFELQSVNKTSYYTLQLALAAAHQADIQLRFNDKDAELPHFSTGIIGTDNAVARHGIHGLYWLFSFRVRGSWLVPGNNTIFMTNGGAFTRWRGLLYDYIRFEGPDQFKVSM
ncbi:PREDICTED: rhamnogalacturonate lyase B-like isoform X2 [Ipomoea nil]|uniref:rhamnogalacturonate lyase B-like isoform X2 n=1 Tax=Ipomoea nil TaxID=35883 RepID=UPI000901331C|nr:PREDICTED: rhamnogalacturonate lyase B-like isoform X2 [Ipomoea nil]